MNPIDGLRRPRDPEIAGYWAEFMAFETEEGQVLRAFQLGGRTAATRVRALAWLRLRARLAARNMAEQDASEAVFSWLCDRQAAVQALTYVTAGEMYLHLVTEGATHYEFSIRPVFLPAAARGERPESVVEFIAKGTA
ncbi:hypothetical protein [Streptomyces sp. NPDC058247]|uniref:hypothetical protein n=1 Tax=Streptomyces sp. NPDC058247 TaxID=3346401 RepID=UPI0036E6A3B6